MKKSVTTKAVKAAAAADGVPVVIIPHGVLQSALAVITPAAYNSGAMGWNYDVYRIDGLHIATGYRVPSTVGQYIPFDDYMITLDNDCRARLHGVYNYGERLDIAADAVRDMVRRYAPGLLNT